MLVNLSEAQPKHVITLSAARGLKHFLLLCPKPYFIIFISNQEQKKHNLHAILVKLHIKNILFRATVIKLWSFTFYSGMACK